jgi:hypothetical protein
MERSFPSISPVDEDNSHTTRIQGGFVRGSRRWTSSRAAHGRDITATPIGGHRSHRGGPLALLTLQRAVQVGTPLKIGGIPHQSRYSWVPERHHGLRGSVVTDLRDLSRRLFAAADQLWTNTDLRPDQYAQPVLALIALRQMEAKFEVQS